MEKGEREVRERKGRGGRRGEGEKGAMGVDPTKFGKKSMPAFIYAYIISNIKTIGPLPAAYNV